MKTLAAQTAFRWLWHSGRQVGSSFPSPLSPVCSRVPLSFHKRLFQLAPTTSHITTITTTAATTTTITRHTHSGSRHQHSGPVTADPRQTKQRFNVGAFGAGRIGRMHLKNVCGHQRLNLKWIVEDNEEMRDKARDDLCLYDTPFSSTSNVPQLLDDTSLDGVFILTPTETHAGLIMQALNKGKAVFVEKPTAETREEIEQCYTLAETKGAHLFTGFQRRLDPVMCDLYSAVRDRQVVGKLYNIKTVSRDSPKPSYEFLKNTDPDGCNILSDMAVHDVDLVVWLTQAEVPELIYVVTHAHDAILAEKGIDDSLMVLIKYKSGIIATIDSCRETTYGYDIRVEVFGSEGMVMVENPRETTSVIDGASGGTIRRLFHSFPERFEKAFQMEIDHFVLCMEGTATAPVTKTQALLTARIIEKGVQSFREKRPVYF